MRVRVSGRCFLVIMGGIKSAGRPRKRWRCR